MLRKHKHHPQTKSLSRNVALSRSRVMVHRAASAISGVNSSALVVAVLCACSALASEMVYLRSGSDFSSAKLGTPWLF